MSYESRLDALEAALRPTLPLKPPLLLMVHDPARQDEDAAYERKARAEYFDRYGFAPDTDDSSGDAGPFGGVIRVALVTARGDWTMHGDCSCAECAATKSRAG